MLTAIFISAAVFFALNFVSIFFRCESIVVIHSKLTMVTAGQKSGITEDIWTSADVPGYVNLEKLMAIQNVTPKMMQTLDQAGCGGFFVKMDMTTKSVLMNMQLVRADRRKFPASMFQIPPGYTPASNMLSGMMQGRQK